jgi:hypothetical protein
MARDGYGILQQVSDDTKVQEDMMKKVGIPNSIQIAIMANHEPGDRRCQ